VGFSRCEVLAWRATKQMHSLHTVVLNKAVPLTGDAQCSATLNAVRHNLPRPAVDAKASHRDLLAVLSNLRGPAPRKMSLRWQGWVGARPRARTTCAACSARGKQGSHVHPT
jgi:hypothetical protein